MIRIACTACDGEAVERIPVCRHGSPCDCGFNERECRQCEGSGEEPCASCGPGHPAVAFDVNDDAICDRCLAEDATEALGHPALYAVAS